MLEMIQRDQHTPPKKQQSDDNRVVAGQADGAEATQFDTALRPTTLQEYVGQAELKGNLSVFLEAARRRDEPLEHTLLAGPPGLGKTTLAHVIGNELGVTVRVTAGPALERPGDLAAILTSLQPRDILFIDEIHRLRTVVEEVLYTAMEDFAIDLVLGKGPGAKTMRLTVPPFTLIGATTKVSGLSAPLRDRFGTNFRLNFYTHSEIEAIVQRSAEKLGVTIDTHGAARLAKSARATPRIANRLLRRMRDFAQVLHQGVITARVVEEGLASLGIDELGLDAHDRKILSVMAEKFGGTPVGLSTIAAATSEEEETIEDVIEPYLLQLGFITRTPRGRLATDKAYAHLGVRQKS